MGSIGPTELILIGINVVAAAYLLVWRNLPKNGEWPEEKRRRLANLCFVVAIVALVVGVVSLAKLSSAEATLDANPFTVLQLTDRDRRVLRLARTVGYGGILAAVVSAFAGLFLRKK